MYVVILFDLLYKGLMMMMMRRRRRRTMTTQHMSLNM